MVHESVMQRLALIKYLYKVAIEQSKQPDPMCAVSILTFHDSVELFLQLAAEYVDAQTNERMQFLQYWDIINAKQQTGQLAQKESMRRLNAARVAFKHHGTMPAQAMIEGFRASVVNFFADNCLTVFKIKIEDISLVNIVKCDLTKNALHEAERLSAEGKFNEAQGSIAMGFEQLINDYETRKTQFGQSPFFFGESLTFESSFFMHIEGELARFVDKVKESIETMQAAMKILSLGLDYRRYTKFRMLTPTVQLWRNGYRNMGFRRKVQIDKADYQFCFDFVIDSAIKLQDFDFDVGSFQR